MATVALSQNTALGGAGSILTATQNSSLVATTNTYTFVNDGKTLLICEKGANACTATVTTPGTQRGIAIADPAFTIAASVKYQILGPFPVDTFNDANGLCSVVFSETTGLIVAAVSTGLA